MMNTMQRLGQVIGGHKKLRHMMAALLLMAGGQSLVWGAPPSAATWYGGYSTDWNNRTNWTPSFQIPGSIQSVPASGSDITIAQGCLFYPVVTNNLTVGALSIIQANGSLTVSKGTLTASSIAVASGCSFTNSAGASVISSGTITASGTWVVNGTVTGPMSMDAKSYITINAGGTVNSSTGGFNANSGGGSLYIYGTLKNGSNEFKDNANVIVTSGVLTSGAITLPLGGSLTVNSGSVTGAVLTVSGGSLTVNSGSTLITSDIVVSGGAFTTTNATVRGGAFSVTGGLTVAYLGSSLTTSNITVNGGGLTINGATLAGGTVSVGNGTVTLNSGANLISAGTVVNVMSGGSFTVNSGATATFAGGLTSYNNCFTTLTGSTINIAGPITAYSACNISGGDFTLSGGTQTLPTGTYDSLTLRGGGTDSLISGITINRNLSITNGTVVGLASDVNIPAGSLTLSGTGQTNGTWGSTSSTAVSKNNTYFSGAGTVTVSTNLATHATTTTLATLTAVTYGSSVVLSATVAPTPPGGTVQFQTNGVAFGGAIPLAAGKANYTNSTLAAGSYTVTAVYSGGSGYTTSTSATATQTVNKVAVTITAGLTVANKVYNGNTTAGINSNNVVLTGVLAGDTANVRLSTNTFAATFAKSGIGSGIAVTVSSLALTGSAAANYSLTQPTGLTASITAAPVTITSGIAANAKVYNASTAATISSNNVVLSGVINDDLAAVKLSTNGYTATFASAGVNSGIAVTVSGLALSSGVGTNYSLAQPTGLTASITAANVSVSSGLTATSKAYDGTTTATISSNTVVLSGVIAADTGSVKLSTNGYTAAFASSGSGTGIAVTVSGLTLTGTAATNYSLTPPTSLTANITVGTVTIASGINASSKNYDGTTTATISSNNVVLSGIQAADTTNVKLSTNGYTAAFASAGARSGISVTVSGLTLTGSAATNYTLTQPAGLTASIATLPVTVAAGVTANDKVYNGTTTATISSNAVVLTGVLAGDATKVKLSTNGYAASFASAAVAPDISVTVSGLSLTGTAATNYTLAQPAGLLADITAGTVTITSGITAGGKAYDGTTSGTINSNNVVLSGILAADTNNVKVSTNGYTATFASAGAGSGIAVTVNGLTLTGSAAGNYTLAQPAGLTAGITAIPVTVVSGVTANNKAYNGTTAATISVNNVALNGVLDGDTGNVNLATNGYTATFASATAGREISVTVSGLSLTGSAAGNYTLSQPAGLTASITVGSVTITSGIAAASKVYNGTTTATITSNNVVLSGVLAADLTKVKVSTNGYAAAFASATAGNGIGVMVNGLSLTGSAAANYTLAQPGLTGSIIPAPVTVASGITADNKAYDGTKTATITSNNVVLTGVIADDADNVDVSTNGYTATFASATAANNVAVTVSNLTLTGSAAANYTLSQPTGLKANITQMTVAITSPVNGSVLVTNATTLTVTGLTSGNAVVSQVWLSADGTIWTQAITGNGWTNWSGALPAQAGTQTYYAYAVDAAGNYSPTNAVSFSITHTGILNVLLNGNGSVTPNYNGTALQIGQTYLMTATGLNGWTFTNWTSNLGLTTNAAALRFTMVSNLTLTANFLNITRPTLTVTKPTGSQQIVSNSDMVAVAGTAAANAAGGVSVSTVWISLDGVTWTNPVTANNWTNWSQYLPVTAGAQTLYAYSVDSTGNSSLTNRTAFTIIHTGPLVVTTNGNGTVSPNYNGQTLQIGQPYTMTAVPALNWKLQNWTSNLLPTTNATVLKFTMASNLTLSANFAYTVPPILSVIALTNKQVLVTNDTSTTVKGTAASKVPLAGVFVSISGSDWMTALSTNGWTNWTAVVPISAGPQTLKSYAVDIYGNSSVTNIINFSIAHTGYMTVRTNGNGTVSPNYDNTYLQIGGVYTMQATGRHGWNFTNWTSNFTPPGQIITNNDHITFQMVSNLVITATFVDISKPIVVMPVLAAGQYVETNISPLVINGRTTNAPDDSLVTAVYYSFNSNDWQMASTGNNFTNWTASVVPQPGTNSVRAYAVDAVGNFSLTNTFKFTYLEALPLTVRTNQFGTGTGTIALSTNGQNLIVGTTYFIKATPAAGCVFSNWTSNLLPTTSPATLTFTMVSNLTLYANFLDITKPTLTITNPVAGQKIGTTSYVLRGVAADNVGVSQVWYSVNSNAWQLADGTTSWSALAQLVPGTNTIRAYALDAGNNASLTNTVAFQYAVPVPLTIVTNGIGSITIPSGGFFIGQKYSLTAVAGAGFTFTNWTASNGLGTNKATLTFTMVSNLVLTANFLDSVNPTVVITSPNSARFTNGSVMVTGMANDNYRVDGVYCQLNNGTWQPASTGNGYTNWNLSLNLTPGTNIIKAYAADFGGRHSLTSSVTVFFVAAPATLVNFRAVITLDDGTPDFEMNFGASTFSQYLWGTNNFNAAGTYVYSNPGLSTGVLTLNSFALPQNSYGQSLQLIFTNRYIASFNYTNGFGQLVKGRANFSTITNIATAPIAGQSLESVGEFGAVSVYNFLTNGQVIQISGGTRQTNNWTYVNYGACGGLVTITGHSQTNRTLIHYESVHTGEYYAANSDGSEDTGIIGFVRPLAGGNAPLAGGLEGHTVLYNVGDTLASVTFASGQFILTTSDASLMGAGTYTYGLVNPNSGQVNLNYTVPENTPASVFTIQFYNPNFGAVTNSAGATGVILR